MCVVAVLIVVVFVDCSCVFCVSLVVCLLLFFGCNVLCVFVVCVLVCCLCVLFVCYVSFVRCLVCVFALVVC